MYNITCMENKRIRHGTSLVLRKGAWTAQEDKRLKNCIEKFGEGKWHLVPLKAGLNRCRKSCRLRWLNYLRPNIKRGAFEEDEVDLLLRLHKLLGNRWSLIAGRIPGRTANDVKNYWNTHLKSRAKQQKEQLKDGEPSKHGMVTAIKPKSSTVPKTLNLYPQITTNINDTGNLITSSNDGIVSPVLVSSPMMPNDKINEYLEDRGKQSVDEVEWSSFSALLEEGEGLDAVEYKDDHNMISFFDIPIDDVFMWDLL
ncbi:hypothetical protein QVD17_05514 [Tagetes erecta]|uniref:Uncharacterized protein n=1 Tax=Tagetes erecta TaxID=13708 RepID=A0AAD8LC49_TARER|nr:hypothetical protein QVD17_05514 [Tagetes erecta]